MATSLPQIKFKVIELLSKNMSKPPKEGFEATAFHFDIKADLRVNPEQKLILTEVEIKIREHSKEEVIASIVIGCGFEIQNFEESIIKLNDTLYDIPVEADAILKSVAISTARGVMFSEFRGTYLYGAILPIVILNPPIASPNTEIVDQPST